MDADLQSLILRRLAELGEPGRPMSLLELYLDSGRALDVTKVRAWARGEAEAILTIDEATALAQALQVPFFDVAMVAAVLPDV